MTSSLLTKLGLAAAATMITLSPALADWRGKPQHSYGYQHNHGKGAYSDYRKRKHAQKRFHHHRHFVWRSCLQQKQSLQQEMGRLFSPDLP